MQTFEKLFSSLKSKTCFFPYVVCFLTSFLHVILPLKLSPPGFTEQTGRLRKVFIKYPPRIFKTLRMTTKKINRIITMLGHWGHCFR